MKLDPWSHDTTAGFTLRGWHSPPSGRPVIHFMHGNGRLGLQCMTNLDLLPATGAVIVSTPLKIINGSGSPLRVIALVAG